MPRRRPAYLFARNDRSGRLGKSKDTPRGGWADWMADRALRGLIALALTLPLRARLKVMGWAVRRVIAPLDQLLHLFY